MKKLICFCLFAGPSVCAMNHDECKKHATSQHMQLKCELVYDALGYYKWNPKVDTSRQVCRYEVIEKIDQRKFKKCLAALKKNNGQ